MNHTVIHEIELSRAHGATWSRAAAGAIFLILVFTALTRIVAIEADPPRWMQGAFISDEGWWADSARGKMFFGNYFSDDFGTAYLVTPGYTWALDVIYKIWGVGTAQTRLQAAFASLLTIAALAAMLRVAAGRNEALIAAAMLALSPFYWSYGRVGMQEAMQTGCIAISFACWALASRWRLAALGSGLMMAAAVVVKPNAVSLGMVPVGVAALGGLVVELYQRGPAGRALLRRTFAERLALACAAGAAVLGAVYFAHCLPNWPEFKAVAISESGAHQSLWKQNMMMAGMFMLSTEARGDLNWPIVWNPAHWSPALMAVFWLYLLTLLMRLRVGLRAFVRSLDRLEALVILWSLATLAVVGTAFYQPDRRYLVMIPCLAVADALFLSRTLRVHMSFLRIGTPRRGRLFGFVLWLVLLLPVMVLIKPRLTAWIMMAGWNMPVLGHGEPLDYTIAGTLFMIVWLALIAALASAGRLAERACIALLRRPLILLTPALLLIVEAGVIGVQFAGQGSTLIAQQAKLARLVQEGETVMGHVASTVFMPIKVHTVRRVSPTESTPPPNPDVWDRLHPRYIIEMTGRNYQPAELLYADLIKRGGYHSIGRFEMGPYDNGTPRYVFELYDRGRGK